MLRRIILNRLITKQIVISHTLKFSDVKNKKKLQSQKSAQKQEKQRKSQQNSDINPNRNQTIHRLKFIQQQQIRESYQQKLQQIKITKGDFNPFTAYLWINRTKLFIAFSIGTIIFLLLNQNSSFSIKTIGVFQDPFTGKKKFMMIHPDKQKLIQKDIVSVLHKEVNFLSEEQFMDNTSTINKVLKRKLQLVLLNLSAKYNITFKPLTNHNLNYQIVDESNSPLLWIIGDQKLVISKNMLRLDDSSLQYLILLFHSLHSRYLNLQNISFSERLHLNASQTTQNKIKIFKIFLGNSYTKQNIQQTIQLTSKKYSHENRNNDQKDENRNNQQKYEQYIKGQQKQVQIKNNIIKALNLLMQTKTKSSNTEDNKFEQIDLRQRLRQYYPNH